MWRALIYNLCGDWKTVGTCTMKYCLETLQDRKFYEVMRSLPSSPHVWCGQLNSSYINWCMLGYFVNIGLDYTVLDISLSEKTYFDLPGLVNKLEDGTNVLELDWSSEKN